MKLILTTPFVDLKREQLKMGEDVMTLREVIMGALSANSEVNAKADDKVTLERYQLSRTVADAETEIVVSSHQITDLRRCLAAAYTNVIAGQAIELIENGGVTCTSDDGPAKDS